MCQPVEVVLFLFSALAVWVMGRGKFFSSFHPPPSIHYSFSLWWRGGEKKQFVATHHFPIPQSPPEEEGRRVKYGGTFNQAKKTSTILRKEGGGGGGKMRGGGPRLRHVRDAKQKCFIFCRSVWEGVHRARTYFIRGYYFL